MGKHTTPPLKQSRKKLQRINSARAETKAQTYNVNKVEPEMLHEVHGEKHA